MNKLHGNYSLGVIRHHSEDLEVRFKEAYVFWTRVAHNEFSKFKEIEAAWECYVAARDLFLFSL